MIGIAGVIGLLNGLRSVEIEPWLTGIAGEVGGLLYTFNRSIFIFDRDFDAFSIFEVLSVRFVSDEFETDKTVVELVDVLPKALRACINDKHSSTYAASFTIFPKQSVSWRKRSSIACDLGFALNVVRSVTNACGQPVCAFPFNGRHSKFPIAKNLRSSMTSSNAYRLSPCQNFTCKIFVCESTKWTIWKLESTRGSMCSTYATTSNSLKVGLKESLLMSTNW